MLKVYEWLVYIIMRPHKSFQHLIKWFGIFIRAKTNYRKRKERLNRNKRKNLPGAQGEAGPPSPAGPQGQRRLLPPPAHPSCSVECHRASRGNTSPPSAFQASPCPLLASWRRLAAAPFHSPLHELPPLLSRPFHRRPRNTPERRRAHAWPSTPRSPKDVSKLFVVVVFVELQKESSPEPA